VRFAGVSVEAAQELARQRAAYIADLARLAVPARGGLPDVETLLGMNLAGAAANALSSDA
jgi:hypothetical protein